MAAVNRHGARLGERDPMWHDLRQYMSVTDDVAYVDVPTLTALLSECAGVCALPRAVVCLAHAMSSCLRP